MTKTATEIRTIFADVHTVIVADAEYTLPTKEILLGAFKEKWVAQKQDYELRYDCDDFAFAYKIESQKKHACGDTETDGQAIGVVFYLVDGNPMKGHAINWADTDQGLIYIEPQTGEEVELTTGELASRFFVYA